MRLSNKAVIIGLGTVGFLAFSIITLFISSWNHNHPAIIVSTDKIPISLEIGNKKYNISKKKIGIRLPKGSYLYKVTNETNGQNITIYGSIDTAENSSPKIDLVFAVYSDSAVKRAICNYVAPDTQNCQFSKATIKTTYINDGSWAVAFLTLDGITKKAVLRSSLGDWELIAGPDTKIDTSGSFMPAGVEEVLNQ
jgi:hypothetical protein